MAHPHRTVHQPAALATMLLVAAVGLTGAGGAAAQPDFSDTHLQGLPSEVTASVLDILLAAKPELPRFKAKELDLFGSFARAEPSDASDVDVLVNFDDDADLVDLVGLAQFLEERLARKVDLVSRRALRPELEDAILREVVPL